MDLNVPSLSSFSVKKSASAKFFHAPVGSSPFVCLIIWLIYLSALNLSSGIVPLKLSSKISANRVGKWKRRNIWIWITMLSAIYLYNNSRWDTECIFKVKRLIVSLEWNKINIQVEKRAHWWRGSWNKVYTIFKDTILANKRKYVARPGSKYLGVLT